VTGGRRIRGGGTPPLARRRGACDDRGVPGTDLPAAPADRHVGHDLAEVVAVTAVCAVAAWLVHPSILPIGFIGSVVIVRRKRRERRAAGPRPVQRASPAPLPGARLEVRGVAGHLRQTRARLLHAATVGLSTVGLIAAMLLVAYLARQRGGGLEPPPTNVIHSKPAARTHPSRCAGLTPAACRRLEEDDRRLEETRRRYDQIDANRRALDDLRARYPDYFAELAP